VAGGDRRHADEALALALACGGTIEGAAAHAKVSERTAYRRLKDPAFRAKVDQVRSDLLDRAVGKLLALGGIAADKLQALLASNTERVQLGAVRTALEHLFKGAEQQTLAKQLEALRAELEAVKNASRGSASPGEVAGGDPPPGGGDESLAEGTAAGPSEALHGGRDGPGQLASQDPAEPGEADALDLFAPGREVPDRRRPGPA
jgi:hypothetical protein